MSQLRAGTPRAVPTRRDFLRLGMALSAMGAAAGLAACGAAASASQPASPSPAATRSSQPASPSPAGAGEGRGEGTAAASAQPAAPTESGGSAAACTLTPEQELGPYYLAGEQIRQDITEGKPGVPLQLRITIQDAARCTPLQNAAVDIWHADATGNYSGFGGGASSRTFLRGIQITNADGLAEFRTIYPGWYPGRAIHIHLRARVGGTAGSTYDGGHVSHTGQLFFDEGTTDQVLKLAPYSSHTGNRTLQSQDSIFRNEHGDSSIVKLTPIKTGSLADGFVAAIGLGVNPNATPAPVGGGGPGAGPGGRPPAGS